MLYRNQSPEIGVSHHGGDDLENSEREKRLHYKDTKGESSLSFSEYCLLFAPSTFGLAFRRFGSIYNRYQDADRYPYSDQRPLYNMGDGQPLSKYHPECSSADHYRKIAHL